MKNQKIKNKRINFPSRRIINKNIYLFTYSLLKSILFSDYKESNTSKSQKSEKGDKLKRFIDMANAKFFPQNNNNIQTQDKLTTEYSKENFDTIIDFIKLQNSIYAGEILEDILIEIFGEVMVNNPKQTINEYIFDNLRNSNGSKNEADFKKLIDINKIKDDKIKKDLKCLTPPFSIRNIYPFRYLLLRIYEKKFEIINCENCKKEYINDFCMVSSRGIEKLKKMSKIISKYESGKQTYKPKKNSINFFKCFFFTLFVNEKIKHDPLMEYNYSKNYDKKKIINMPYTYDIDYGFINLTNAIIIISPIKLDKRIKNVSLKQNNIGDIGLFEMGKALLFNPEIKVLNYSKNLLRSDYWKYFIFIQKMLDNFKLKELNISNNKYLKEDFDNILCNIIKNFKGLETLNISINELKSGITKFCIELNKLYRLGKCKLKELNLSKCCLDHSSLYELSEVIKSKYCKLETLVLSKNNLKDFSKLFTAIKKNNSLIKLIMRKCCINNNSVKKINEFINKSKTLESLDISKNIFKSSDTLCRIIARTKILNKSLSENAKIMENYTHLINLDISNNPIEYMQNKFSTLLQEFIEVSNLIILDSSRMLYTDNLNRYLKSIEGKEQTEYTDFVKNNLVKSIEKEEEVDRINQREIIIIKNKIKLVKFIIDKELCDILKEWRDYIRDKENVSIERDFDNFIEEVDNKKSQNIIHIKDDKDYIDNNNSDRKKELKQFKELMIESVKLEKIRNKYENDFKAKKNKIKLII